MAPAQSRINLMKKFLLCLFCITTLAGSSFAAAPGLTRATVVTRLDSCEAVLQEIQANLHNSIPAEVLKRAKGLVIVNQFQAGFILGVKDGYAVAMVRRPNGKWSVPAFLRAGELSVGLQFGGKSVSAVYVLMNDNATKLLLKNRMNLGAEAKVTAGIRKAEKEGVTRILPGDSDVLVYTNSEGLYLGAAIKTGYMSPHEEANRLFYNTNNRLPELLYSDWVTPPAEAAYLMNYVTRLTQ